LAPRHRSKGWLVVAALPLAWGCSQGPDEVVRQVRVNASNDCQQQQYLLDGTLTEFIATGDFQSNPANPTQEQDPLGPGITLAKIPPSTREMTINIGQTPSTWLGITPVAPAGDVDIFAWPFETPCSFSKTLQPLGSTDGTSMGPIDADGQRLLIVGSTVPPFVADMSTGVVTQVPLTQTLNRSRAGASITVYGTGALVAGGRDPNGSFPGVNVFLDADVFQPSSTNPPGSFRLLALRAPRADHGAATLQTGQTLLVGGRDDQGAALSSMEVRDTDDTGALAAVSLKEARFLPTVLRLPDGHILVAGGFAAASQPSGALEWFDAAVSQSLQATDLPSCALSAEQGFVPLVGGAVLAVTGAMPSPTCTNVYVVRADGTLDSAPPLPTQATRVRLFAGVDGQPILWTGSAFMQWQPWQGTFTALTSHERTYGEPTTAIASFEPGLAFWLANDSELWGMRAGARGPYATDESALLVSSPLHTAPDRLASSDGAQFTSGQGVTLANGAEVWVTDATYGDVTIDVVSGPFVSVLLRDGSEPDAVVGGQGGCPLGILPVGDLHVERRGATVRFLGAESSLVDCTTLSPTARVSIGLRGPPMGQAPSVVTSLTVSRAP
jgi:hypothetical protein